MTTKNANNIYKPEIFTVTTQTAGSDGVTNKGVHFKLNGTKGSTEWMLASDSEDSKGEWTGKIQGVSVGEIKD